MRRSVRKITPNKNAAFVYDLKSQQYRQPKQEKANDESDDEEMLSGDSANDTLDESVVAHTFEPNAQILFEENRDVAGEHLYGFRTPKKRNGMALRAAITPKTPKTPATALKSLSLDDHQTPRSNKRTAAENTKTPHNVRRKFMRELKRRGAVESEEEDENDEEEEATDDEDPNFTAKTNESSSSSDQSDSDEAASDESIDENTSRVKTAKKNQMLRNVRVSQKPIELTNERTTRLRRRKQLVDTDFMPQSDNYFSNASTKKVKTSNHTLDRLKSSRLQYDELFGLLRSIKLSDEHLKNTSEMLQDHQQYFGKWMLLLSKGFNVITYGIGSKQCVLQEFCETYPNNAYIIVNGFFPTLTVKEILNTIRTDIVTINGTARGDHEIVDAIANAFKRSPNTHLFLIVHNIDGPMLRKTKDQHILSRLAKINNVHLIASIDHINAPLIWDQTCLSNFNFIWFDCTTMLPYANETAFENSVFLQNSGELGLAAMSNVFQSLTTNARGIYMLLVETQIKNKKDSNFQGENLIVCNCSIHKLIALIIFKQALHSTTCIMDVENVSWSVQIYLCVHNSPNSWITTWPR